ncbi:SDR family NAD(P)-dependent oxidoreductase [Parapedobacter pyrenivorans]|uniref:SDR family NAD(P)-dependent oxidoreductase n=1 Tax=Parapedobacter pyrenivorans TaxID=1305674 RepID=UPI003340820D
MEKVAIISGTSRGIGYETAVKFAEQGYRLAIMAREEHDLLKVQDNIEGRFGTQVLVLAGDLAEPSYWNAVVEATVARWGRIDVLVNNAAWRTIDTLKTIPLDDWERTVRICLTAPAFLAKYVAAVMERQQEAGVIINISSVMAQRAGGYSPAYIACKGGMESLTYEMATCYGRDGIRVVGVSPGNVQTAMSGDYQDVKGNNISKQLEAEMNQMTPLGRAATPGEIADLIAWLASDQASFITGTTILADGGFSHNFNSYASKKLQFPKAF